MSSPPITFPLAPTKFIAEKLIEMFQDGCDRIEIAGSIRRRKDRVKDIELLIVPTIREQKTLLPGQFQHFSLFDVVLNEALKRHRKTLQFDRETPRNGPKYKRLRFDRRIPVDVFIVPPTAWGAQMAIRTGPSDVSKLLVTHRRHGGLLPDHLNQRDGHLWDREGVIETPEESDYFEAMSLPVVPPEERTPERMLQAMREAVHH